MRLQSRDENCRWVDKSFGPRWTGAHLRLESGQAGGGWAVVGTKFVGGASAESEG